MQEGAALGATPELGFSTVHSGKVGASATQWPLSSLCPVRTEHTLLLLSLTLKGV